MSERAVLPRPADIHNGMYRHYKGQTYEVYGISQNEATGVWCVLYRNPRSGEPFHRPAEEFREKFRPI